MCLMLFAVMPSLPPAINLLIVSGLFSVQGARNLITLICYKRCSSFRQRLTECWMRYSMSRCCHDYLPLGENAADPAEEERAENATYTRAQKFRRVIKSVTSFLAQLIGLGMQVGGLVCIMVLLISGDKEWRWFGVLVVASCLLLSFCWCDQVQRWTFARSRPKSNHHRRVARNGVNTHPSDLSASERRPTRKSAMAPTARRTTSKFERGGVKGGSCDPLYCYCEKNCKSCLLCQNGTIFKPRESQDVLLANDTKNLVVTEYSTGDWAVMSEADFCFF